MLSIQYQILKFKLCTCFSLESPDIFASSLAVSFASLACIPRSFTPLFLDPNAYVVDCLGISNGFVFQ